MLTPTQALGDFNVLVPFCLTHLLRDIRFLVEHPNPRNRAYGRRLPEATRQVFHVIHQRRKYSAANFQVALQNAADELWAQAVYRVPGTIRGCQRPSDVKSGFVKG